MKPGDLVTWTPLSEIAPARGRVDRIVDGRVFVTVEYRNLRGQAATGEVSFADNDPRLRVGGRHA